MESNLREGAGAVRVDSALAELGATPAEESGEPTAPARTSGVASLASQAELRELVGEYLEFVWRSLRRLGVEPAAVDDAAQQVFWIAAQKLEQIRPGRERSFLYGTALRVASDVRRVQDRRKEREASTDFETWPDDLPLLDEIVDLRRARDVLDRILDRMPLELRTVFVLTEAEGLSASDISELLEIPAGTVASRLRRSREMFERSVRSVQHRMRRTKGEP